MYVNVSLKYGTVNTKHKSHNFFFCCFSRIALHNAIYVILYPFIFTQCLINFVIYNVENENVLLLINWCRISMISNWKIWTICANIVYFFTSKETMLTRKLKLNWVGITNSKAFVFFLFSKRWKTYWKSCGYLIRKCFDIFRYVSIDLKQTKYVQ